MITSVGMKSPLIITYSGPDTQLSLPESLKLASLCAGSGTGELTFQTAVAALSDHFLRPLVSEVVRKGNSRMNVKFVEFQQSMKNGDMSNSSVSTFYGTLGTIEMLKPSMFVLENVDSVGSETSEDSNLSEILDELRSVNSGLYSVYTYYLATDDFLLPQSRTSTNVFTS